MSSLKSRVTAKIDRFRARHRKVDHVVNMVSHYGSVNGNAQAGAVTFFGFLSFFPILALAFFAVGVLAQVYPDLRADIRVEIENLLPGVIGAGEGEIPLKTFEDYGGTVGFIGLLGVLYSGLGWLSGMRDALETMFVMPKREQPNFLVGKVRDLATLALIGLTMVVSVALSGLVAGFSTQMLDWVGVDPDSTVPKAALWVLSHGLAIAASTVLLWTLFQLLAKPHVPRRSLFDGALLGAIGFEVLKGAAYFLIAQTKGQPAFQAFGVALILVVWINYFSRLVMYAASYAYTSPAAVELRTREATRAPAAPFQAADVAEAAVPDVAAANGAAPRTDDARTAAPEAVEAASSARLSGPAPGFPGTAPSTSPAPARPSPATSGPATSGPATSGQATSGPATSGPATSGPATSGPATGGRDPRRAAALAASAFALSGAAAVLARRRERMKR